MLDSVSESEDEATTDTEGEDEQMTNLSSGTMQYDTDLPTAHGYLGKFDDVHGYTLFDHGETLTLLGIFTNTMVFPGFTLPLLVNNGPENDLIQSFLAKQNIFVLLVIGESNFYSYGVTMEIYQTTKKNGVTSLKARGRQRCYVLPDSIQPMVGRMNKVTVTILAEQQMHSPIRDTQLLALKKHKPFVTDNYDEMMAQYKYRRYHLAQFPYCSFVYDMNEVCFYVKILTDELAQYYPRENLPTEAGLLSYWFAQNFLLKHEERLKILKADTDLERLRLELQFTRMKRVLCCYTCKTEIADLNSIFPMSKDGAQNNFCNPGGFVYETVTILSARNYQLVGSPSKAFSWFPGYAWTIMQCSLCKSHIGWRFTAKNLQPDCFFGFAKSGFDIKIVD